MVRSTARRAERPRERAALGVADRAQRDGREQEDVGGLRADRADLRDRACRVRRHGRERGELLALQPRRGRLAAADIPVACVPIRERDGRVTGLIALHELLPHKASFDATDRALLNLLSIEAARALDEVPQARVA